MPLPFSSCDLTGKRGLNPRQARRTLLAGTIRFSQDFIYCIRNHSESSETCFNKLSLQRHLYFAQINIVVSGGEHRIRACYSCYGMFALLQLKML